MSFDPTGRRIRQRARIEAEDTLGFDFVLFDVVESETHRSAAKVTDHPVEAGAEISDHVVTEPDTLDLVARVSNTPIVSEADAVLLTSDRVEEAYTALRGIKERRTTVSASTTLRVYEGMIITELSVTRDAATGDVLAVALKLREVRTVVSALAEAPHTESKPLRGRRAIDEGKKATEPAPAPVAERSQTILLQLGRKLSNNVSNLTN